MLKRGWTYGSLPLLRGLQAGIKLRSPQIEAVLEDHWHQTDPDLVVSLIPNFNGVLFRSLRNVRPDVPYVTVMTDIADRPPHFWQEEQDQFIICGSDRAVEQARMKLYRPDRILRVSGMVLKPDFYQGEIKDRRAERQKQGLNPDLPTALIMFGGNGSKIAIDIVEDLERLPFKMQSIVMCGNNQSLKQALAQRDLCLAVGFTDRVPDYMRLADFFIGKPGPGSISEALHIGLPVIVERNRRTMPQEQYNTEWITEKNVGLVVKDFRQITDAVIALFKNNGLEKFQKNASLLNNRALFEIPEILARLMSVRNETEYLLSSEPGCQ
ncbi:MAG: glycosyltransferase [Acidiphilium sp.]|nr:glycosyltransferase [Acidiphilium sp.]MDD4936475.1 glycosyltransferase [Acidiphilium sp.]